MHFNFNFWSLWECCASWTPKVQYLNARDLRNLGIFTQKDFRSCLLLLRFKMHMGKDGGLCKCGFSPRHWNLAQSQLVMRFSPAANCTVHSYFSSTCPPQWWLFAQPTCNKAVFVSKAPFTGCLFRSFDREPREKLLHSNFSLMTCSIQ